MDSLGRLLLRLILVPLGYLAAVLAGTLVILLAAWRIGESVVDADGRVVMLFGFAFAAPILLTILLSLMWLPGAIGILIAEAFAIRSWMFHAGNGALSAWIGWSLFGAADDARLPLDQPLTVLAAGLAGGFAYWAVAGWSAGFWKPVFRDAAACAMSRDAGARPPQLR